MERVVDAKGRAGLLSLYAPALWEALCAVERLHEERKQLHTDYYRSLRPMSWLEFCDQATRLSSQAAEMERLTGWYSRYLRHVLYDAAPLRPPKDFQSRFFRHNSSWDTVLFSVASAMLDLLSKDAAVTAATEVPTCPGAMPGKAAAPAASQACVEHRTSWSPDATAAAPASASQQLTANCWHISDNLETPLLDVR